MRRGISTLMVATALSLMLPLAAASQDVPPEAEDLCREPKPGRAIKLALDNEEVIVAVAEATGPRDLEAGTPVRILRVVEGTIDAHEVIADRQPTLECLSEGVWVRGQPVVGVFLAAGGTLTTLAAWPWVNQQVVVNGVRLTLEKLLELGRTFVEPTPTPLPPGVPSPPTLVPPHSAEPQQLPDTGGGSRAGGINLVSVGLAIAALASAAGWLLWRRRGA